MGMSTSRLIGGKDLLVRVSLPRWAHCPLWVDEIMIIIWHLVCILANLTLPPF
jgi:hypothetical protein